MLSLTACTKEHTQMPRSDQALLEQLYADTWSCLDAMIDPTTGFPQDTQKPGGHTNTTNLGLYLASLCCAYESGLINSEHGYQRAEKLLASLESFERMHGFMPHIIEVDLSTQHAHGIMAVSDFNKLTVGLVMVRQTWPELAPRITAFLDAIEWERLYNPEDGTLSWGYNFDTDTDMGWGHLWLTADTRSAAFMMVATEAAPPEIWARMERHSKATEYGTIYRGYGMGGLFLHAMDGLFLPEKDTEVGMSAGNLAWQQMHLAAKRDYPFWGWSNCYMPGDGYTEGGYLNEKVVTPHTIALMIEYYPKKVTAVLREMIKRGGTIPPKGYEGQHWGLRDAYNMETDQWDERYLSLDQGMLFLALANYLQDGMVRNIYTADPLVQNGLKRLEPFIQHDPNLNALWAERDQTVFSNPRQSTTSAPRKTKLTLSPATTGNGTSLQIKSAKNDSYQITFDARNNGNPIHAAFECQPIDLTGLKAIELDLSILSSDVKEPGTLRLLVIDQHDQERFATLPLKQGQSTYRITADELLGIHLDEAQVNRIHLEAWTNPWFYSDKKLLAEQLSLELKAIRLDLE
jgi:hypothetical protein